MDGRNRRRVLLVVVVVGMVGKATSRHRRRLPLILGGTVGDPKDGADPEKDAPQHRSQLRLQVEAHQVAHQDVVAGDVGRELEG